MTADVLVRAVSLAVLPPLVVVWIGLGVALTRPKPVVTITGVITIEPKGCWGCAKEDGWFDPRYCSRPCRVDPWVVGERAYLPRDLMGRGI